MKQTTRDAQEAQTQGKTHRGTADHRFSLPRTQTREITWTTLRA